MTEWIDVALAEEFTPGTCRTVDVDGVRIAVFNVDGSYYAIEDICSHEAEPLSGGEVEGVEIICPRHGARFCLRTGEALTPPAYEPVRVFATKIDDGHLWVRAD